MMKTKELIKQVLEKWNFPVLQEREKSLVFRYEMSYIQINIPGDEDCNAIAVTLSGFFTANNDKEMALGLRTCNLLNYELFQVKLYIDRDNDLVIAAEFFFSTHEDIESSLMNGLKTVIGAKRRFNPQYEEFEKEGCPTA